MHEASVPAYHASPHHIAQAPPHHIAQAALVPHRTRCLVVLLAAPLIDHAGAQPAGSNENQIRWNSYLMLSEAEVATGGHHAHQGSTSSATEAVRWAREGGSKLEEALERQRDRRLVGVLTRLRSGELLLCVELSDCAMLRDSGVVLLCETLMKCEQVQELKLQRTGCTHLGAGAVAELLLLHLRLRLVALSHNDLGDVGARAFAPALRGSVALTTLHLASCRVGDGGAASLAAALAARCYSGLTELSLAFNELGTAGVRALRDGLLHNRRLRALSLCGAHAPPEELAAIQASRGRPPRHLATSPHVASSPPPHCFHVPRLFPPACASFPPRRLLPRRPQGALRPSAKPRPDASSVQELVTRLAGPPPPLAPAGTRGAQPPERLFDLHDADHSGTPQPPPRRPPPPPAPSARLSAPCRPAHAAPRHRTLVR